MNKFLEEQSLKGGGVGGGEEKEMMLLVWLLRDTFSRLWNVIGGLGIYRESGRYVIRCCDTSRLWVHQLRSFCVDRER